MPSSIAYVVFLLAASAATTAILARRRASRPWQAVLVAVASATSVVSFGVLSWGHATPFGDFDKAYYPAGSVILSDPARLYACEISNVCFVNIPIVAVFFAPLALLGRATAHGVYTAVGIAAVATAVWLLIRQTRAQGWRRYGIIALFAMNGPLLYSVRLGNTSHIVVPIIALAFICATRGREAAGSALLAVATIIKPPLLLFLPYFAARGRWRAALGLAGCLLLTWIVSEWWFGRELHTVWLRDIASPFGGRPLAAYNVQSISGLLARIFEPGNLTNWMPLEVDRTFTALRYALTASIALAAGLPALARGTPRTPEAQWLELCIVLMLTLLVSPITWTHYYAFCLIPLAAYVAGTFTISGIASRLTLSCAAVLVSLPVVLAIPASRLLRNLVERVFISHYVIGGVLLMCVLSISTRTKNASVVDGTEGPSRRSGG